MKRIVKALKSKYREVLKMMDLEYIEKQIKENMSTERYQHSQQVSQMAVMLAEYYHLPTVQAKILGLVHDCAKDYSLMELKQLISKYHLRLNNIEINIPGLWHAYVGAELVKDIFEIQNKEMLNAIRYHSTASIHLGLLGKILYIADKIEPGRKTKGLKRIRKLIWKDINLAMIKLLDQELRYLISRKSIIHPDTLQTRNKMVLEQRKKHL